MLYSAKYNFIYSKSVKTGSTSTEKALEYLITDQFSNVKPQYSRLFPDGSRIGFRGREEILDPSFNTPAYSKAHQSLVKTRDMIGAENFNLSYKISSIRNPYDRLISAFHFVTKQKVSEFIDLKQNGNYDEIKNRFASYLKKNHKSAFYDARTHFFYKSKMVIDKFVRMESMTDDLKEIFDHLKVPKQTTQIIMSHHYHSKNSGRGGSDLNFSDYYTKESLDFANKTLSNWFALGGYVRCESTEELRESIYK